VTDAGRSCPTHYRYRPEALAGAPVLQAETLYVVGGLYGNVEALHALDELMAREPGPAEVVFNGDFNWFDVATADFATINRRVLAGPAIQGNVEAELGDPSGSGCGCAYPDTVEDAVVERSNRIIARLQETAGRFPDIRARLRELPMVMTAAVGDCRVGIVHGDAVSLAGWSFDLAALPSSPGDTRNGFYADLFRRAGVRMFASSHTCSPCAQVFDVNGSPCALINNGAAGMPNFQADTAGLVTRISLTPPPESSCYGSEIGDVFIDAIPLRYGVAAWQRRFLSQWPPGSPAHASYFQRIVHGTGLTPDQAARHGFSVRTTP
jgi:hypothetical protein